MILMEQYEITMQKQHIHHARALCTDFCFKIGKDGKGLGWREKDVEISQDDTRWYYCNLFQGMMYPMHTHFVKKTISF